MSGAKQPSFCGAVARAPLIGVKFGGFDEGLIGSRSKMGKLQFVSRLTLVTGFAKLSLNERDPEYWRGLGPLRSVRIPSLLCPNLLHKLVYGDL